MVVTKGEGVSTRSRSRDADFEEYVLARRPALVRTAYLMTGDLATAEDVVQTALAKLYLAWDRVSAQEAVHSYARRIVTNEVTSQWRRAWRRHEVVSEVVPEHGAELADELERIVALHDASTIAAVIVEPVAGSTGVLLPPKGYLQRLREITKKHGILLIFDEVITGYGRLGTPFGADYFGVTPDIMVTAKGLTNGVIPMGAVLVTSEIHDAFMTGPEHAIEFMHGYTYSGNPMAAAAGLATLETYRDEGLLTRGAEIGGYFADALHSLKGEPNVIDIRNIGLVGAIELQPIAGSPTKRAFSAFLKAFDAGVLIRTTGDIIALSPPLIVEKSHIDRIVSTLRTVLKSLE